MAKRVRKKDIVLLVVGVVTDLVLIIRGKYTFISYVRVNIWFTFEHG